jgi:hypothetical protein
VKIRMRVLLACFVVTAAVCAQSQSDPNALFTKKPPKGAPPIRTVQGLVNDQAGNPADGAIVALKNLKTAKTITFFTKQDGTYVFHDLRMDEDFELTAKRGPLTAAAKKLSVFDSRRKVTLNFQLEPKDAGASPQ